MSLSYRLFLLIAGFLLLGTANAGRVLNDALATRPFSHHIWQDVLIQHVSPDGSVDFAALAAAPKRLNQYMSQLESASPENHPEDFPTPHDALAYWINAHNAIALRLILDRYPAQSLADIPGFSGNTRYKLGGKPYSLVMIREKLAIAGRDNPHVLFSLVDYTQETPPIARHVYEGDKLTKQLAQIVQAAVANPTLVAYDPAGSSCLGVTISPFFRHYEALLFARPGWEAEDRDIITEESEDEPPTIQNWIDVFRPAAPPGVYADLGTSCAHPVRFMPENPLFRQVEPGE